MTTKFAKFGSVFAGVAMALSFASPVGAATVAELQNQINLLMAQLATLQGGSSASVTFTTDLTLGSKGDQVSALQQALVAKGFLKMPAGVAYGYFGNLTKSAVAAWQAANGITPAVGYFGPKSRAAFGGAVAGTPGTPATPGATGITTPGAEGTITVTTAPVANTTVYEGQDMKEVLAFKVKATGSDVAVQRVKVDLGTDADVYRKVFSKIYLVDAAGKTLASSDLNSTTVIKNSGNEYEITLSGFSSVVAKDTTSIYSVKVDVVDVIEAADLNVNYTLSISENGVRAIDGAGIDIYADTAETGTRAVNVDASLTESATLSVSNNTANPVARELVASSGSSENEADKVALLVFDIKAEKDDVEITDMINFAVTAVGGTGATASTTYLYSGNGVSGTMIASDTGSGTDDVADFTDISVVIPAGTTKTFTLAADIRGANTAQTTFDVTWTVNGTNIVAENTAGDAPTISGSASANDLLVRNVGPIFTIVGTPTISRTVASISTNSTSTATAVFNVNIKAVGADLLIGTTASTSPFASNGTGAPAKSFTIYQNGSSYGTTVYASSTDYSAPSGYTAVSETITIAEGNSVTIPVTFWFQGKLLATGADIAAGSYALALERLNWVSSNGLSNSTFMAGKTEWRTPAVSLP